MPPNRLVALTILFLTLSGVMGALAMVESEQPEVLSFSDAPSLTIPTEPTTTTTVADFDALVQSAAIGGELDEVEHDLTEQVSTTSTTSTTTTTVTPTPNPAPKPKPAPPPDNGGPAPTTTTTTPAPTTTTPPPAHQPGYVSAAESDFAGRINSYRSSNGESNLSRNGSLDSYARTWAKKMAENGSLSHSGIGSLTPPWSAVGENIGTGGSVGTIFGLLVDSSGHRAVMLGDYTHFGIGVWKDADGRLWTTHVYAR